MADIFTFSPGFCGFLIIFKVVSVQNLSLIITQGFYDKRRNENNELLYGDVHTKKAQRLMKAVFPMTRSRFLSVLSNRKQIVSSLCSRADNISKNPHEKFSDEEKRPAADHR